MIRHLCILLAFQLAGEALVAALDWPLPGPVMGMLLLLLALLIRGRIAEDFAGDSQRLLHYLPLVLIPPSVGIMQHGDRIAEAGLAIILVIVLSTLLSLVLAGLLLQRLGGRR